MTEKEWLECTDPQIMLEFLKEKASDRKLRLFAVACCRKVGGFENEQAWKVINGAELYAEGQLGEEERASLLNMSRLFWRYDAVCHYALSDMEDVLQIPRLCVERLAYNIYFDPYVWQCHLTRCLFNNPFHSIVINPAWRTPMVSSLAQAAYQERQLPSSQLDASRLAVLADALEDAGCDDEVILGHLRQTSEHYRGCWAVDLVFGKK